MECRKNSDKIDSLKKKIEKKEMKKGNDADRGKKTYIGYTNYLIFSSFSYR